MTHWIGKLFGKARTIRKAPKARPGVEALEAREVPALLFTPMQGPETPLKDGGKRLGGNPVYLIFNGNTWGGSASSAAAQPFVQAASKLLWSNYQQGLDQYGIPDYAHLAPNAAFDGTPLVKGFTPSNLDDVVSRAISSGAVPAPTPNIPLHPVPIYVVVTDPTVTDPAGDRGYNTISNGRPEIWVDGDSVEAFSSTLSHELAESMTDPGTNGYEVNPGSGWKGPTANAGQIGDYEGSGYNGGGYAYRMANGVVAQPYWSNSPSGWLGAGSANYEPGFLGFADSQLYRVTAGASFNTFSVVVNGDGNANTFTVTTAGGVPEIIFDGVAQPLDLGTVRTVGGLRKYVPGKVTSITINTGGGNDTVNVNEVPAGMSLTVHLGGGNDTVTVGASSLDLPNHIKGPLTVDSTGSYALTVYDTRDSSPPGTLVIGPGGLSGLATPAAMNFDVAHLTSYTAAVNGSRSIQMLGSPTGAGGKPVTLELDVTGLGVHLDVADNSGTFRYLHGSGTGGDVIRVHDNHGNLFLTGTPSGDDFEVLANHGQMRLDGQAGKDFYNVHWDGRTDAPGSLETVTVVGTGGPQILTVFDDTPNQQYAQYDMDGQWVGRYGILSSHHDYSDSVHYVNMTQVNLNTGTGDATDAVTLRGTSASTTVATGLGSSDTVNVQQINNPTEIDDLGTRGAAITSSFALGGALTVKGNGSTTSLGLTDAGAGYNATVSVGATVITRSGNGPSATVTYQRLGALNLSLGQSPFNSTWLTVTGTAPGTTTMFTTTPHVVQVDIGDGTLNAIREPLHVPGTSKVVVHDANDASPHTAALTQFGGGGLVIDRLAPVPIFLDGTPTSLSVVLGYNTTAAFANVPTFPVTVDGGGRNDTIRGSDGANTWQIFGAGGGTLDSTITFQGMMNLQGGAGADLFAFSSPGPFIPPGSVPGSIDGGGGVNRLDYSALSGVVVVVDLPLHTATEVGGAVRNIRDVTGSPQGSVLVGDGTGNVLRASMRGRSILIAGAGPATLLGSVGDDILIGGTTAFDQNLTALNALFSEWNQQFVPIATEIAHIESGGGLNGSYLLNASTVHSNGGGNTLTGNTGGRGAFETDLYFGSLSRDKTTYDPSHDVFVGI